MTRKELIRRKTKRLSNQPTNQPTIVLLQVYGFGIKISNEGWLNKETESIYLSIYLLPSVHISHMSLLHALMAVQVGFADQLLVISILFRISIYRTLF